MLRFLLNLSITPLPAKELDEFPAKFLNEFVYQLLLLGICWGHTLY